MSESRSPIITLEALTKRYGKFEAVKNLSLCVYPGEVFGFLGRNGAGKTTTLRMITGLIQPSSGKVGVGRWSMHKNPVEAKQMLGFIPDRPFLYEKISALEFMRFVAGLHHMPRARAASRSVELLERFELTAFSDTRIESYSHGMKQRLVFAAALLPEPEALIVDEPMVGLDPQGKRLVKNVFRELCRDEQLTVFLSTHTLEVAEEVCHRIAILDHGELVSVGDLSSLRQAAGAEVGGKLEEVFFELTQEQHEAIASVGEQPR